MKRCPTCQRTYADDEITFCLVDGSILSAPYDPQAHRRTPEPSGVDLPATEVLHPAPYPSEPVAPSGPIPTTSSPSPPNSTSRKRSSRLWIVMGGAVVLITVAVIALSMTNWSGKPNPEATASTEQAAPSASPVKFEKDVALRSLSNYKIGIYYPNNNSDLAKVANNVRDKLVAYTLKKVRIELSGQDDSFFEKNVRPNGYEIRYEPGYEDEAANALFNILKEVYPEGRFQKMTVGNRSEDFLSIFLGLESPS